MTLGDINKDYRKKNDLSMDAFSDKSGISKAYISLLEKNRHPKTGKAIAPSIHCIKQAADGMNMDFNVLFGLIDGNVVVNDNEQDHLTQEEYAFIKEFHKLPQQKKNWILRIMTYALKLNTMGQEKALGIIEDLAKIYFEKIPVKKDEDYELIELIIVPDPPVDVKEHTPCLAAAHNDHINEEGELDKVKSDLAKLKKPDEK